MASTTSRMSSGSTSSKFARAFSLKDRKRPRSKLFDAFSDSSNQSNTPTPQIDYYGLFTLGDQAKKISKDEDKKIQEIKHQMQQLGCSDIPDSRIAYTLRAKDVGGDPKKAIELLILFTDSVSGLLRPFNPDISMLGAENREKVTCYLDALLFAMFAKTTVFEAMLYHTFEDEARKRLVTILRLWINMLRTGKLITTDITRMLQEALSECGWTEGARLRQQDASEAFGFITDKLQLPLLTLKTDLFHQGKHDKDDHKFITERLLDVAVPEEAPSDEPLPLEKCLEEYFNNKVEVRRELQRRNTKTREKEKDDVTHVEVVEAAPESPLPLESPMKTTPPRPLQPRDRATSIFSERRVEIVDDKSISKSDKAAIDQLRGNRKASILRKEVAMPAWQFVNLIPWYADHNTSADNQMKAHFASKRPVLGICLKRYKMGSDGSTARLATKIDIPLEMAPPHFAVDDRNEADESANPSLKLVLQSVVCHRGSHVTSGHYIALVRTTIHDPHSSFSEMTAGHDEDSSKDVWLRHDDLATSNRVSVVDINEALKTEYPYLLFYQVLPVDGDSLLDEPPPYQESLSSFGTVSEKLAHLQSPGRPSVEIAERGSRRVSTTVSDEAESQTGVVPPTNQNSPEITPDESQSQVIAPISGRQLGSDDALPTFSRQDSGGAIDTSNMVHRTRPTTPYDDAKPVGSPRTKQTRQKGMHRSSMDVSKKIGEFTSKFGGSNSREKVNIQEIAVAEESPDDTMNKETANEAAQQPILAAYKGKSKDSEKKAKNKSKSRRSSVPLGKLPDRDCVVM